MSTDSTKLPVALGLKRDVLRKTSVITGYSLAAPSYYKLTIPHGQPFIPLVDVYAAGFLIDFTTLTLIASTYIPLPIYEHNSIAAYHFPVVGDPSTAYPISILYGVDATNIYVEAYRESAVTVTLADIAITCDIHLSQPS